ncbi:transporter suffix domain-containing protein [Kitasatospora sp. NPDC059160]|uniref:transporter suffix domain-containing protein n=1 Tax=Kitasatospora sp. NPDC059160 TaxID=3346748 RepID=UPI0036AEA5DE
MTATPATSAPPKKPLRFRIGIALLVLSALTYVAVLVILFLPLESGTKAAAFGGTLVVAETCALIGMAGVGKEAVRAVRSRLGLRRRSRAAEQPPTTD